MNNESLQEKLRTLPSVEELLQTTELRVLVSAYSHPAVAQACRSVLAECRENIMARGITVGCDEIVSAVESELSNRFSFRIQPVINATGIILHTNLGRAPISVEVLQQITKVASSYNNLEYVLESGQRGQRGTLLEALLSELTGAEAACVVNNNAGAMFLILSALAQGKEVIVSRGELVQIGGGFRIPEILSVSGAVLKEVGTTNQTTLADYEKAISDNTALILKVHHSNFKMKGFVKEVSVQELSQLAKEKNLVLIYDQGSGAVLDTSRFGLAKEPTVQEGVSAGADLVAFSGDKLLGGPQAGIIVGRGDLINQIKKHPLFRASRTGKFTISGLEETIMLYLKDQGLQKIPIWQMISRPVEEIQRRAQRIINQISACSAKVSLKDTKSYLGGGSLPDQTLPSFAVCIETVLPLEDLSRRFRKAKPPVIGRISEERYLLDLRTVFPEQASTLADVISQVLS